MINRNYLPFKSAREYVDRKMAKWMGFFISEHTTALKSMGDTLEFKCDLDIENILFSLSSVYISGVKIMIYTDMRTLPFVGKILEIDKEKIYFNTEDKTIKIPISRMIRIILAEDLL